MVKKINTILFLMSIISMPILYFVLPKQTISVDEKRKLATIPQLNFDNYVRGDWADSVDNFVDDHFPYRKQCIDISARIQSYKGIHLKHQEKIFIPVKHNDLEQHQANEDPRAEMSYKNDFDESYNGALIIIDGCVYPMGGGSPAVSKSFSKMVNEYARELKGETRVFSAVAPLSSAFMPVEKYKKYHSLNQRTLKAIGDNLADGAIFCDVFDELDRHKDQKLFFNTDHHWKPIGAYYAYVAFCKAAGKAPVPLDEMTKKVKYNFLGTLYQKTLDPTVRANADTMEYYVPKVATTAVYFPASGFNNPRKTKVFYQSSSGGNTYSTFLGGDVPLMKINTTIKNGKKAIVVKNSMGNAFTPFLTSHYEEIWVVDLRYSKHNILNIIRENKIDDMIFAVGMYAAMSSTTINMMRNLAKQDGSVMVPKRPASVPADTITSPVIKPEIDTTINN